MRSTAKLFPILALGTLLAVSVGCGSAEKATPSERPAPVAAQVAVAELHALPAGPEATGTVEPWARATLATRLMGRIERFSVREGDVVRRGQLLVELDKRDLDAAVRTAEAAVQMAEAQLTNAKAHHERILDLRSRGSVTVKNAEDALAGFRVAEAGLAQAKAAQAAAEVQREYAEIRAPFAGVVSRKLAERGDLANPGMPVLVIEDLARVKLNYRVAESQVVGLAAGQEATVLIEVLGLERPATIDRVLPAGDPASRTYEVRLVLANADGALRSGMFARARFGAASAEQLAVPQSSLVERGQLSGLFVVGDDGVARLRWVRLGEPAGELVAVLSGLERGERYVSAPPAALADGTPVEVR